MAQFTTVSLVCDEPHDEDVEAVATLTFAANGTAYELDVCAAHEKEASAMLGKLAQHARKVVRSGGGRHSRAGAPVNRTADYRRRSHDIRLWAQRMGLPVSERGRIPQSVAEKYDAAGGKLPGAQPPAPERAAPARFTEPTEPAPAARTQRSGKRGAKAGTKAKA